MELLRTLLLEPEKDTCPPSTEQNPCPGSSVEVKLETDPPAGLQKGGDLEDVEQEEEGVEGDLNRLEDEADYDQEDEEEAKVNIHYCEKS